MNVYKYVNRTSNTISVPGYSIGPYDGIISETPIAVLDSLDGVLVDTYLNGEAVRQSEFNPSNIVVGSEKGAAMKMNVVDPKLGWHDLLSPTIPSPSNPLGFADFIGSIKEYQFSIGDESYHQYHLTHDYAPNTDMYLHVHWSHTVNTPTAGDLLWEVEMTYAKGYGQAPFSTPVTVNIVAPVGAKLLHNIHEVKISSPGGVVGLLDSDQFETDGMIKVRLKLLSSTSNVDMPFLFFCDAHYQSTNLPTVNRNFNFWT